MTENETSLLQEIDALLNGFWLTDLANFSSFFFHRLPGLNWAGFYLSDGEKLRLGPFCGKPACMEIAFNRGVCGTAFRENRAIVVDDVHLFEGHVSCDPESRSELVVPFSVGKKLMGVFDLDSPSQARFLPAEAKLITSALECLARKNPSLKDFPFL